MHEYDQVFAMEDEVEEEVAGATEEEELDEDELKDEDEVPSPIIEEEEEI